MSKITLVGPCTHYVLHCMWVSGCFCSTTWPNTTVCIVVDKNQTNSLTNRTKFNSAAVSITLQMVYRSVIVTCQCLNSMCVCMCVFPGAEQASITVRANIQVAQSQVMEARKLSEDADKKLAETKAEEIQRMAEYTAFLEKSEEHEVHEAYLRED